MTLPVIKNPSIYCLFIKGASVCLIDGLCDPTVDIAPFYLLSVYLGNVCLSERGGV